MNRYCLGSLQIDVAARRLSVDGVEVPVQPLVFEFLAYLLRNTDRAVAKDELLDRLWPGVNVTESSLQRVASLARGVLRQGGAEAALESVQRFGYRLRPDQAPATAGGPADDAPALIGAARAACAAKRWQDGADLYAQADAAAQLGAAELEEWGLSLECIGRPAAAIDPLTRAVAAHVAGGNRLAAANPALALSRIHLERAEMAVARGWHGRAADLIGASETCREHGLWCWMGSRLASAAAETEEALGLADRAYEIGKRVGDPVVESLGLIYRGFFELCLGDTERGLEDQDVAATLGLSSEIDPVVGGTIYCNLLWACRNFADWRRASHWSASYERWCRSEGLEELTGSCRLHRAEALGIAGTLDEAKALVLTAIEQLENDAPWALGDAARVLGDIHLAAGDLDQAGEAYGRSSAVGWSPQPGLALLQLERGEAEAANLGLERCLQTRNWPTLQRKGLLLATLAKIAALTGRHERAAEIVRELETQPQRWPMPSIRALTSEARAALLVGEGRILEAIAELLAACDHWREAGSILNYADTRLCLAALLSKAGDRAGARIEAQAVDLIARKTGSARLARKCREFESMKIAS
ncbi:MAG TPA: winged helix-turn-helix domain-containing protein [Bauldia sp.]|nr:winged helix-turn-helix domain-containing protein [Bauldia sp.]